MRRINKQKQRENLCELFGFLAGVSVFCYVLFVMGGNIVW